MSLEITIHSLSVEILLEIFEHLDGEDLTLCRRVCNAWSRAISAEQNIYVKKLKKLHIWGDYLQISNIVMSDFGQIYGLFPPYTVTPKQAYYDWTHPMSPRRVKN